ncbi:zinc finger CCCH domain-containing protein 14 [Pyxicephalus adspersus]|uniref:zinc finger CCCH domain-containing protein 14 n=1 Tax=Pyxicephalus adspersus TaxID=30357 RepID=UPI003B5A912C
MEIGTEISRKIRTAIKGKLQELGAYVDEELPDYIMVMVANKKSQEQMTDDLSLFLGNNTLRFTTWLQGVLDKLRAVTPGSNSLKASEAIIFNSSMPPLKSQSREDSGRESQPQRQEKFYGVVPSSSHSQYGSDRVSTEAAVAARLTSAVKPLQESTPSEDIIDIKLDMDDAFNEDLSCSSGSPFHPRQRPADYPLPRTQRPSAQVYRPPGSTHRLDERSTVHRLPQSDPVHPRQSTFHGNRAIGNKPYEMREASRAEDTFKSAVGSERTLQTLEGSRKRRIPVASSVVKVKRFLKEFEEEEEEEEEEDYISWAAALPSSVSVPSRPERRPTLPPSKQANKNLILKAISEAQESITKTTSYSTAPQKQTVPVAPRARPVPEEELILMKSRASMLRYQEEAEEAPAEDNREVDERRMGILSRLYPEPMEETATWGQVDKRRMDVLSRLNPEPVEETTPWGQGLYHFIKKFIDIICLDADPAAVPAKAKIHERCKYWPACKNAENCAYHHPTTVCKAFPKCRFAEKCFFIHPNCKFDAKCAKADCPYTHASRRMAPPPVKQEPATKSHVKAQCRYFPACKNTECPYYHPKHCRFSSNCTRMDCEFYHPKTSVPPRHALTWIRSQASD